MKITDSTATQRKVRLTLRTAFRPGEVRTIPGGEYVQPQVRIQDGATEYVLAYGNTGEWRLSSVNTYGNYSGVHGQGCDASGLVITDLELMEALDNLFA